MSRNLVLWLSGLFAVVFAEAAIAVYDKNNNAAQHSNQSVISYQVNHPSYHSSAPVRFGPDKPVRLLVRLSGQPLAVFQKQQRHKLAGVNQKMSSSQQQAYDKAALNYQQKLRVQQQQLITRLQQTQKLVKVHRQFIKVGNLISITANAGHIDAIRQLPEVEAVYLEREHRALLEDSVKAVGAPQVWSMRDGMDRTVTGRDIRVAILDTGIDYTHPDLGGCVGESCKVIAGVDFSDLNVGDEETPAPGEGDFRDYNGHGTHVAGIVAADGGVRGVAPDARLYAVKVLGDSGFGSSTSIIAGIEWAVDPDGDPTTDDGAHVMNLSLGGAIDEALNEAVNTAMDAGVVVVVAAGNNGRYNSIDSPGSAEKVVTVGAIDKDGEIAIFSSRGPVRSDHIKPDLVAPGVEINSTWLNGTYKPLQGTSMASPHVAGAAALLRQLHPELSTADIKSLLVNRSRPLALDVFTQGAGAMDLFASAQSQWLLTPSTLLLGRFTPEDDAKTVEAALVIKNIGEGDSQIQLGENGTLITGAEFAVTGDTATLVAPGEQRELAVSLTVDNASLPFADNQSLHHESYTTLVLNEEAVRLPYALIKSALLKLQMESTLEYVILLDKSGDGVRYISSQDCSEESEEQEVSVRPGHYKTIWMFANEPCIAPNKMVFAEDIQIDSVHSLEASADQAVHELGAEAIINEQGESLALDEMSLDNSCVNLWHPAMEYLYFDCGAGRDHDPGALLRVSDIPSDYVLDYAFVLSGEGSQAKINHRNLYMLSDKIEGGLAASRKITLDLDSAGHIDFNVINPHWNNLSFEAAVTLVKPLGVDGKTGIDLPARISGVYSLPASFSLHGGLSDLEMSEWFAGIELQQIDEDENTIDNFFRKALLVTGPVGFIDTDSYFKFTPGEDRLHVFFQSQDNESHVLQRGYYFSARASISPEMNTVEMIAGGWPGNGLQKDETHNLFGGSMPFTVLCDDEPVAEDDFNETFFADFFTQTDCQRVALDISMDTQFFGVEDTSSITIDFARQPPDSFDNAIGLDNLPDWMEAPSLEDLTFFNDGEVSRLLTGEKPAVRLRLGKQGAAAAIIQVSLSYRLEGQSSWTSLALEKQGGDYTAGLPVMNGSHLGSLKLIAEDERGHRLEQTLNSVFYLGRDAEAEIELPPVFGQMGELTIEAMGPLTDISFFGVEALDPYGGPITATLESEPLLALGTHEVIWKAVGSTGLDTSVSQTLHIVDTTPPELTVPASSSAEVAAEGTVENPANPTALDRVDGEITPVPDQVGPFAQGEYTITWTASDNSGNTATALQTLTVTAPTAVAAPTPSATSDSSGGGGSFGFWWLLCLALTGRFIESATYRSPRHP